MTQFRFLIEDALVEWLYARGHAERWQIAPAKWSEALYASAARAFEDTVPSPADLERYLKSLHLEDLALACACAAGHDAAWEYFVREQRPALYRAADVLDATGAAHEIADSLYADLYGFANRQAERQSLFRHFHGRSRLSTWLRAILTQRHVDRLRTARRLEPLPDDESPGAIAGAEETPEPERQRCVEMLQRALNAIVGGLPPRDRLRLRCYYAQGLTLAETGRLLSEHEATVSRHLARTRRRLRDGVERLLQEESHLTREEMADCFATVAEDSGSIDLGTLLGEPTSGGG